MSTQKNNRNIILCLFILLVISIRVIAPLLPNFNTIASFSGLGAIALFAGSYFKNKWMGFVISITALLISDIGLVLTMGIDYGFYPGWHYTYIAMLLMVLVGQLFIKKVNVVNVIGGSLLAVFVHWVVSDFGVWYGGTLYPQTMAGFWTCLVAAIPFELKFLYGTLIYAALMFTLFETAKAKYPVLQLAKK